MQTYPMLCHCETLMTAPIAVSTFASHAVCSPPSPMSSRNALRRPPRASNTKVNRSAMTVIEMTAGMK